MHSTYETAASCNNIAITTPAAARSRRRRRAAVTPGLIAVAAAVTCVSPIAGGRPIAPKFRHFSARCSRARDLVLFSLPLFPLVHSPAHHVTVHIGRDEYNNKIFNTRTLHALVYTQTYVVFKHTHTHRRARYYFILRLCVLCPHADESNVYARAWDCERRERKNERLHNNNIISTSASGSGTWFHVNIAAAVEPAAGIPSIPLHVVYIYIYNNNTCIYTRILAARARSP